MEEVYHSFVVLCNFSDFFCPSCGENVVYHGRYRKNFYKKKIRINRVRCCNDVCKTTHAIIPSFSVPCCSTGMKEMDQFITSRKEGATISEAGQCFVDAGMSPDYPEFIHRKFKKTVSKLSTIFEIPRVPSRLYTEAFYYLFKKGTTSPVSKINELCRLRGFNPVCSSRCNILLLPKFKEQLAFSHNPPCLSAPETANVQPRYP